MLLQNVDGYDLPVSYASRSLTKGETNKSTIEKELAAIHFGITHFRPYVYGTRFVVRSDHKPLSYMYGMKNPSSKLLRTRLDLEEYTFDIEYIKGKDNVVADALSRINIEDLKTTHEKSTEILMVQTRSKKHTKHDKNNQ